MRQARVARWLLIAGAAVAIGCSGARYSLDLENSRYVVSMTDAVIDEDGEFLSGDDLIELEPFSIHWSQWAIGWSLIPLNRFDLGEDLNRRVEAVDGEAIIDFTVTAERPIVPGILPGVVLGALPIMPMSVGIDATGTIVRRAPKPASPIETPAGEAAPQDPALPADPDAEPTESD